MSTQTQTSWVDLLSTAKTIRRSVRPVTPSPRFRSRLRDDLAWRLVTRSSSRGITIADDGRPSPMLVVALCLGLFVAGMAYRLLRTGPSGKL